MLLLVQFWIWISTFATFAGWALSAAGQLNRSGYAIAFAMFAVFVFWARKNLDGNFRPRKIIRCFRRPLPLCFAGLAAFILLGASLYPPDNYTALTYRFPRALQWLAHDHWFWIHTANYRMNDRACGIEWLSAPCLLFTKSTRLLFLPNFLPFLLLPGLVFSVLTRLGISSRVAWQWMWLLPTGYNFLLQAGSAANDTFPAVYALAAIDFALRAQQSNRFSDAAHSILSAALLTGAKASNLPLLLLWVIIIATSHWWRSFRIVRYVPIILIAATVSFLPTAILNSIYCRDWSGAVLEPPVMTVKNPLVALAGNTFQLLLENFCPPFFPQATAWNTHASQIVPTSLLSVSKHFDEGFFQLGEMPTEDLAGLGFGLSILLLVSIFAGRVPAVARQGTRVKFCLLLAPWLALLAYCLKSGMTSPARLIAPYYPLLLPLLLTAPGLPQIIRRPWWRVLVYANLIIAFAVLILTPARPLWPAQTILSNLVVQHPDSRLLSRAQKVYSLYSSRFDSLSIVRDALPDDLTVVGFAGGQDDAEISLWLPLGSRHVEDFLLDDPVPEIKKRGIEYAVIGDYQLLQGGITIDDWLKKSGAQLLAVTHATLKITTGTEPFYVVQFK